MKGGGKAESFEGGVFDSVSFFVGMKDAILLISHRLFLEEK